MNMESKDKKRTRKKLGFHSILSILGNSMNGFYNYCKYERSAIIYFLSAIIILILSFICQLTAMEWMIVLFLLLVTLAVELLNTAIEAVCDLVSPEFHPLVKVAKDSGSAATGALSLALLLLFFFLFLPKLIEMFE